jgi:multicomponent Na+:H+ antiporter subunit F
MPELIAAAVVLTATLVVALIPMIRATSATDRMLATQLIGTSGVGLLLLLAPLLSLPALIDVALMLALLAAVALVAFTRRSDGKDHA